MSDQAGTASLSQGDENWDLGTAPEPLSGLSPGKDYVWPGFSRRQVQEEEDAGGLVPVTRVIKHTYARERNKFWNYQGKKTVSIGQYRFPMEGKRWNVDQLRAEFRRHKLAFLPDAFPDDPDVPWYCQLNNCWAQCEKGKPFCSTYHERLVEESFDRVIQMG